MEHAFTFTFTETRITAILKFSFVEKGKTMDSKLIETFECPVCGFVFKADTSEEDCNKCPICLNMAHVFDTENESYHI